MDNTAPLIRHKGRLEINRPSIKMKPENNKIKFTKVNLI